MGFTWIVAGGPVELLEGTDWGLPDDLVLLGVEVAGTVGTGGALTRARAAKAAAEGPLLLD